MVVVGTLHQWEPVRPVVLAVVEKYSEVGLYFLVNSLGLSVHLGVVGHRRGQLDPKEVRELSQEARDEGTPPVAEDLLREAMMLPDVFEEKPCDTH
jgi:hypothetical protein